LQTAEEKALRIARLIGDRRREATQQAEDYRQKIDAATTMHERATARHYHEHWSEIRDMYVRLENDAKSILDS